MSGPGFSGGRIAWFELFVQTARDTQLPSAATDFFDTFDRLAISILRAFGVTDPESAAPMIIALLIGAQLRKPATGGSTTDVTTALTGLVQALTGPPG